MECQNNCVHTCSQMNFTHFSKNFCWRVRVWLAESVESGSSDLPREQQREKRKAFPPHHLFNVCYSISVNCFADLSYYILFHLETGDKLENNNNIKYRSKVLGHHLLHHHRCSTGSRSGYCEGHSIRSYPMNRDRVRDQSE